MLTRCSFVFAVLASLPIPVQAAQRCAPQGSARSLLADLPVPRFLEGPAIGAADIRTEFDGWLSQMNSLHPDMALRTDVPLFEKTKARIRKALNRPMTQREVWEQFALLNPSLRDGHNGIGMPDSPKLLQAHLDSGGRVFPLRVRIGTDGMLRVGEAGAHGNRGDAILAINGRPADRIVATLLSRAPGETLAFRREWVSRRFTAQYWLTFGDTGDYAVTLQPKGGCRSTVRVPGASELAISDLAEVPASHQYAARILDGGIGYLKAGSFSGEYQKEFAAFTKTVFADFKKSGIRALIIDVRENGGGDDPLWQQNLMEYITTKPYAHVGRFAVRVNKDNADPGDVIGELQRKEYKRRFTPTPDNPLRLDVPVYILDGRFSYSSTIQFLVAAQDFGIAKIAGPETGALSCQTGQVKFMAMPKTGLRAYTPVIAFVRPSGAGCDRGVIPDLTVDDDGLDPDRAPRLLAEKIVAGL